jgi:uncharacterized protein (DUF302 family)
MLRKAYFLCLILESTTNTEAMNYFKSRIFEKENFESLKEKTVEALKKEGFGILTEIDIQETMKKKLDKEYAPYVILGACNPVFADKVLQAEPHIGTLLPCNVTIRELENGSLEVAVMDPVSAMSSVKNAQVEPLAKEVGEMLTRALDSIN